MKNSWRTPLCIYISIDFPTHNSYNILKFRGINMSGKGSRARPLSVPREKFEQNWDAIFGKKKEENPKKSQDDKKETK